MLDHIHPEPTSFIRKYIFSIDHKVIGIQYMITGGLFFLIAGLLAETDPHPAALAQRRDRHRGDVQSDLSMHGSAMVWMVIIPLVTGGFGNFVMPLQIGARDVAFPWLNLAAFWMFPVAGIILSPRSSGRARRGLDRVSPGLAAGAAGNLDVVRGDLLDRHQLDADRNQLHRHHLQDARAGHDVDPHAALRMGAVRDRRPLVHRDDGTGGALLALFLERTFGVPFYDPKHGGSPILWQHMFWFYSHPAVYIMILPVFGIISEVLPTFSRKPVFGYKMIAFSSVAIALLGFSVWAHHMFTSGMVPWLQLPFMIITMVIAIPTGIKIFSWMATLWGGSIHWTTPMLFATGFLITFTCGGLDRILPGRRAARLPRARNVFRRRPFALRALRRLGDGTLRRHLLLVAEDDRADVQRGAGGTGTSG